MTYADYYSTVDFEFPDYEPIYPIKVDNQPVFNRAQFQGSIEQVTSFGQNQLPREFIVEYNLPHSDANIIDNFLSTVSLYNDFFFWSAAGITDGTIRVTCEKWNKEFFAHNRAKIKATFVETFDFSPRNYGFIVNPSAYQITPIDSTYIRGVWLGGDTATYALSLKDASLVYSRNLFADTAVFNIDVLPAGPEIYFLDADNAAEFSIVGYDSDYVIGAATVSDYFASMSAQIYGWDRDFQVDWWGD